MRWDANADSVAIHRVVQNIMRDRTPEGDTAAWVRKSLELLDTAAVGDPGDVRTWETWDALRPHIATSVRYADNAGVSKPTSSLMVLLGKLLYGKALHDEAEPLIRRALAIDKASYGPDHPTVAIRLNNLAQLLQATNRYDEAEPLMRRALDIDEASYELDHPNVARDLNNLATLFMDTNRYEEAEPLMRRLVEILAAFTKRTGHEHPHQGTAFANYAGLLQAMGRSEKEISAAVELMQRGPYNAEE